jgi:hypothetical protein
MSNKENIAKKLDKRTKTFLRRQEEGCEFKIRHSNVLTAIRHCKNLEGDLKRGNGSPVIFYHCDGCGFAHVGHLGKSEGFLMYGGESVNIRELQK